eukprot:CAMPEP_0171602936 /NCGR_PEP_ID=MMETSP0990-20121206/5742_1 /TAXON_ID=483369 /ORGANISM="non described non described, Strain CCMP2098" /LENGTH=111 /DNA_ID=CAMNT_0012165233 /DNA_START=520 /DNA_END=855 /DNA_ORIENTATION=+
MTTSLKAHRAAATPNSSLEVPPSLVSAKPSERKPKKGPASLTSLTSANKGGGRPAGKACPATSPASVINTSGFIATPPIVLRTMALVELWLLLLPLSSSPAQAPSEKGALD